MNRRIYKLLLFCMVSMLSVFVHAADELQVTYHKGFGLSVPPEAIVHTSKELKCDDCIAILYVDQDYGGSSISLGEGNYTQDELANYGISAKNISSLKVTKGFKITLYENADFTGNSKSWTTDASFVGGDWNDKACSVRIEPNGKSGLSGNFKIMNRNSGKYLDLDNNKTDNNTAIVQFDDEGVDASQTWTFTEVMNGKGVYSICSYGNKNRGMDVADFSKENGAQVQLYDYLGNPHQQFILYDCGEGYYQLVARNSGKVVEIPQSSKGNGEWIKIYDNNGTHTQQWAVVENRYDEASAVTLYTDKDYKGKAVTLSEGEYNLSRMGLYNLKDNDMSSLKVTPGFKVTIYADDNFQGTSKSYIASESFVGEDWNDKMSSLTVEAYHELQVTYQIGDASEAVTSGVSTEGSLATLLGDKAMNVTQLSVKGYLNDADINLLQKMAGGTNEKGSLKSLNLSEATFTATGKKVPTQAFQNCKNLQQVDLSGMTAIGKQAFKNCAFTEFSIPASVTKIEEGAFAGNSALKKVIVHSAQIDARSYDGEDNIFYDMEPNDVQVVFMGAAEDHYKNYRNDIVDADNSHHKNAFMYLLTKTLDENSTDYTVVPQRHADVRLKRTFKEGWNTLVLPFGARDNGEAVKCARIYQKALNVSKDEKNFMIAAYRGLAKNTANPDNSTFYFLKYANYDTDPLDECEPLLIKMTQKDIDNAKGVYTFMNVELNYDGDNGKTYTADEVIARMGKKENGNYFDGNYDKTANDKFGKCSYDDFYFTGTLYQQVTDENSDFIAPGDYIIQNNTFVKCLPDKKYGLKGFRGYFKQKKKPSGGTSGGTSGGQSGAKGIGICLVDRNGVVSSIHQVDGVSLTPASVAPAAVYNLSGQQVGNSLSTLAKGVYIVNGKKFVKK